LWSRSERSAKRVERGTKYQRKGFLPAPIAPILYAEKIPIYLGNFVLMEYGTGAVMAVPVTIKET
jgi:leucyl-tRNA synthetase